MEFSITRVKEARHCLKDVLRETPCIETNEFKVNHKLYLKAECLQKTGAFKLRGAYYKIANLTDDQKAKGIICASAGNHAQGVAYAANLMDIQATIVMPKGAPLSKVEATKSYGVDILLYGDTFDEAYHKALEIQKETGATFIEPFNDLDIIHGQGTLGLEILDQVSDIDYVLVPIGGGGLAAGVASAIKAVNPNIKVYGVEALDANCMSQSLDSGNIVTLDKTVTLADGIAVKTPGTITYELCKKNIDKIISVTEEEITSAILQCMECEKLVVEGAGAVTLAAALYYNEDFKDKKVVAILSGGNIDVTLLSKIIDRGLVKTGRKLAFGTLVPDKPGHLAKLMSKVAEFNGNIISIQHDRSDIRSTPGNCYVEIAVETSNQKHINSIIKGLEDSGYIVYLTR